MQMLNVKAIDVSISRLMENVVYASVEYYSVLKRKKFSSIMMQSNLEDIILSETSQL